jgi:hypothetical protein
MWSDARFLSQDNRIILLDHCHLCHGICGVRSEEAVLIPHSWFIHNHCVIQMALIKFILLNPTLTRFEYWCFLSSNDASLFFYNEWVLIYSANYLVIVADHISDNRGTWINIFEDRVLLLSDCISSNRNFVDLEHYWSLSSSLRSHRGNIIVAAFTHDDSFFVFLLVFTGFKHPMLSLRC